MSVFDAIDRRFQKAKRPPDVQLNPHQAGQDCPSPHCRGKLAWQGLTDQYEAGGRYLACDDPNCGWREGDRG